jgi:hypothetical protein
LLESALLGIASAGLVGYAHGIVLARILVGALLLIGTSSGIPRLVHQAEADGVYSRVDDGGVTVITDSPTDPRFRRIAGLSGTATGWLRVPQGARGSRWGQDIKEAAERYGVDPALVQAVIGVESAFNPWAVSRKGAQGLMQLMPRTASMLGVRDSFNPRENIEGGVRHLRYLLDRYPGNTSLALAAYNAGEGAVDYYGGIPPYPETQQYVQKVLERGGGVAQASAPARAIYRSEDVDGTVIFSNVPPLTSMPKAR